MPNLPHSSYRAVSPAVHEDEAVAVGGLATKVTTIQTKRTGYATKQQLNSPNTKLVPQTPPNPRAWKSSSKNSRTPILHLPTELSRTASQLQSSFLSAGQAPNIEALSKSMHPLWKIAESMRRHPWIDFLDGFEKCIKASPYFYAFNLAVAVSVMAETIAVVPSIIVHATAFAVHTT